MFFVFFFFYCYFYFVIHRSTFFSCWILSFDISLINISSSKVTSITWCIRHNILFFAHNDLLAETNSHIYYSGFPPSAKQKTNTQRTKNEQKQMNNQSAEKQKNKDNKRQAKTTEQPFWDSRNKEQRKKTEASKQSVRD